jgi:hypothetical protein
VDALAREKGALAAAADEALAAKKSAEAAVEAIRAQSKVGPGGGRRGRAGAATRAIGRAAGRGGRRARQAPQPGLQLVLPQPAPPASGPKSDSSAHPPPLATPTPPHPQGLEREYDRLLADHDRLKRDYAQATGGRTAAAAAGGNKKAE